MTGSGQDLHYLIKLALDKSIEGRRALTATIGDLFSARATVLTEREHALMTDILRKLIRDCEMAVRRDLGERLTRAPDPPHELILALANDEIEVAEPVLMQCEVLRDIELIQIIRHRTQQHQLAIAMRRSLSEYVSDALVETGNVDVIKTLLENHDAHISEATMTYLAEESRRVDTYQEPLIKRKDLQPELAKRMYLWVSAAVRQHILENFDVDPSELDDQLEGIPQAISSDREQHRADPGAERPAAVLAQRLARKQKITWEFLIQILRQGEIPLFEALFGELSGLKAERVQRVLYDSGGEGLAIACRALEMPKPTFATIFLLSRRGIPGKRVTDPRELSRALFLFDKMNPKTAMQVLKGWRRDGAYQDAIEQVAAARREPEAD
ncbi:MAG: DUF2336 domain-containing protein [Kiloniellaceae bacterium]